MGDVSMTILSGLTVIVGGAIPERPLKDDLEEKWPYVFVLLGCCADESTLSYALRAES